MYGLNCLSKVPPRQSGTESPLIEFDLEAVEVGAVERLHILTGHILLVMRNLRNVKQRSTGADAQKLGLLVGSNASSNLLAHTAPANIA